MPHFLTFRRGATPVLLSLLLMLSATAGAASENNGATGLAFLKVGVDARASGMGEAYTAVVSDANATFWNPAGLMEAGGSNLAFQHNEWLFDISADFGAAQWKWDRSAFGVHVYNLNVGDIPVRTGPSSQPLETTEATWLALGASYARDLRDNLTFGLTVKYLYEKIYVEDARGMAVDAGFRYRDALIPNLSLGGVVQHLGSMSALRDDATTLPTTGRLGVVYDAPGAVGPLSWLAAADLVFPFEESLRVHVGGEGVLWEQLALRAGWLGGYDNRGLTLGLGIRKTTFHIDYSFTPFQDDLGNVQRFSLLLAF